MEICILNTQDIYEAMLVQSKLESYGIFCNLRTNDAGGTLPHLRNIQGIQLFVCEEDLKKSQEILKNLTSG